ncbi:MAG TPA: hypothetical protein VGN13_06970 [Solirubrobacteraceae bacterium]
MGAQVRWDRPLRLDPTPFDPFLGADGAPVEGAGEREAGRHAQQRERDK